MNPYIELIRPKNAIMAAVATYLGYCLALGHFGFSAEIVLLMAASICISGGGQAINDFFDWRIDVKVHPHRPIPSKKVSVQASFTYAVSLFFLGNVLALVTGMIPFTIAFVFTVALIGYARFSHHFKWLGNWLIGLASAFTFIFGASLVHSYELAFLASIPAFFISVSREITKDLEDHEKGETEKKALYHLVGKQNAKLVAILCVLITLPAVMIPLGKELLPWYYLIGIGPALLVVGQAVSRLQKNDFEKSQQLFKLAMMLAMAGFAIGLI